MSELPSKYSSNGLSPEDQRKVITTGAPRKNRPIGAIKIEERVNHILDQKETGKPVSFKKYDNEDTDGDVQMLGFDDEIEVQFIADYVHNKRETDKYIQSYPFEDNSIDLDTTPEPKPTKDSILVLDTNFMISHLDIVDKLAKLHSKYHHTIIIPTTVAKELDGLKGSKRTANELIDGTTVGHLARWANDWIYSRLADLHSSVRGQKLREVLDRNAVKDDSILDCCLYFRQKENALVVLLSNDKNLCMKSLTNEILTVSYRKGMTAETIARKVFQENQSTNPRFDTPLLECPSPEKRHIGLTQPTMDVDYGQHIEIEPQSYRQPLNFDMPKLQPPINPSFQNQMEGITPVKASSNSHLIQVDDFGTAVNLIYSEVQKVVSDAVDNCMRQEYEDDLDMVAYDKETTIALRGSANVMIRFWVSVFTEYFQTSSLRPFNSGRKEPKFIRVPSTASELHSFIEYWSEVLRALYIKRGDTQNVALGKIIDRWEHIAKRF